MRDRLQVNVVEVDACTGISQQCPPPTIKVEKVNGGLRLFGVLVGNNCQISLPAFGALFSFIGIILSIVAFKTPAAVDQDASEILNREETVRNIRILGPVCTLVGISMIILGAILKHLSRKAQDRETRIGFYCPVHGDFYPLSPNINPRKYSFSEIATANSNSNSNSESKWWSWLGCGCVRRKQHSRDAIASTDIPPCPHSISASNRSSFDGQLHQHQHQHQHGVVQISNLNPNTIIITTTAAVADGAANAGSIRRRDEAAYTSWWTKAATSDLDVDAAVNQSYTSVRSLSVPNEVASFPSFRSKSNPPTSPPSPTHTVAAANAAKRLSCPILPEIGGVSPLQIQKRNKQTTCVLTEAKAELKIVQPATAATVHVQRSPRKCAHTSDSSDVDADINVGAEYDDGSSSPSSSSSSSSSSKKRKSVSIFLPDERTADR